MDFAGEFLGHHFLILVDAKSKWLEVKILKRAPTTDSTINLLMDIFSFHGFPKFLVSDNATIFKSQEFVEFCRKSGIIQKFIAPGHPATNGLAERHVKTVKQKLLSMKTEQKSIQNKVREIVFRHRALPLNCGKSPAELYLGRSLRIELDAMFPPSPSPKNTNKNPVRTLSVGERVQVQWYSGNKNQWRFGNVTAKFGKLHYEVKLDNGYVIKRHINQLRSTLVKPKQDIKEELTHVQESDEKVPYDGQLDLSKFDLSEYITQPGNFRNQEDAKTDNQGIILNEDQVLRRSNRVRKPNVRFQECC